MTSDNESHCNNPRAYYKHSKPQTCSDNTSHTKPCTVPLEESTKEAVITSAKILPHQWIIDCCEKLKIPIPQSTIPTSNVLKHGGQHTYIPTGHKVAGDQLTSRNNAFYEKVAGATFDATTSTVSLQYTTDNTIRYNIDRTVAPHCISRSCVDEVPNSFKSVGKLADETFWEYLDLTDPSIKQQMNILVDTILNVFNSSEMMMYHLNPYLTSTSQVKKGKFAQIATLYKQNIDIAKKTRADSNIFRMVFNYTVEHLDTSGNLDTNVSTTQTIPSTHPATPITSNDHQNWIEVAVATSNNSSKETILLYFGVPDGIDTEFNVNTTSPKLSSRSSLVPSCPQYNIALNCVEGTPCAILCKVQNQFNTPIYVNPSIWASVDIPVGKRVSKVKINMKGAESRDINIWEAFLDDENKKILLDKGKTNNWINICNSLIGKDLVQEACDTSSAGNYLLLEIPYTDPDNTCIIGGEVVFTSDISDIREAPMEVEVSSSNITVPVNVTPVYSSTISPISLSLVGSLGLPSIFVNSRLSFPLLHGQYTISSSLVKLFGSTEPVITSAYFPPSQTFPYPLP